ncbi:MAG: fused MFS/spermidine synthase [Kiritimatiellia bacterium]
MNKRAGSTIAGGTAIFLGSALLFNVQPMLGRLLLPRFGGSAAVWTTCLVAFQLLLLGGYAYAALLSRLRLRTQRLAHILLLFAVAAWPGVVRLAAPPEPDPLPALLRVLLSVLTGAGPAYLLLASGNTLLQVWLARAEPGRNVYRLYAVSNAGSLIGLFAYPFLIEPFAPLPVQQTVWRALFALYAGLLATLAVRLTRVRAEAPLPGEIQAVAPPPAQPASAWARHPAWWWLLPLLSSFLLTAATASLTQDITPLPMVWCLLLGSFLLSYIIGFTPLGESRLRLWSLLAVLFMAGYAFLRWKSIGGLIPTLVLGNGVVLFGGLFLCGWLYAIRPETRRLPLYYLALAAGGATGGALAGLAAPLLLKGVYEYSLAAMLIALLAAFVRLPSKFKPDRIETAVLGLAAAAVLVLEPTLYAIDARHAVWSDRNFYGVLRVTQSPVISKYGERLGVARNLVHGATIHGIQMLTPAMRDQPTQYYGANGGGYPIRQQQLRQAGKPLRVGVVGLGIGTLAAYGREGDLYRFYEINPRVIAAARNPALFSFLADSAATVQIAEGDARLVLERERAAGEKPWDVLIVDAFTGDAVPLHLLTREAVTLFLNRTAPDGLLAFHISNRFVDLLPLLKAAAGAAGARFQAWHYATRNPVEAESRWVLLSRTPRPVAPEGLRIPIEASAVGPFPVMTDTRGSVLPLIDWGQGRLEAYLEKAGHQRVRKK